MYSVTPFIPIACDREFLRKKRLSKLRQLIRTAKKKCNKSINSIMNPSALISAYTMENKMKLSLSKLIVNFVLAMIGFIGFVLIIDFSLHIQEWRMNGESDFVNMVALFSIVASFAYFYIVNKVNDNFMTQTE